MAGDTFPSLLLWALTGRRASRTSIHGTPEAARFLRLLYLAITGRRMSEEFHQSSTKPSRATFPDEAEWNHRRQTSVVGRLSEAPSYDSANAFAGLVRSMAAHTRLVVRTYPALNALMVVFDLSSAYARIRADSRPNARALGDDLEHAAVHIENILVPEHIENVHTSFVIRRLEGELASASKLVIDLASGTDPKRSRDLAHRLDRACFIARELAHRLSSNLARDLISDPTCDIAAGLACDLDRAFNRAVEGAATLTVTMTALARDFDRALHDFTKEDLRGIDLSRLSLEGLRWSESTQWPSNDWKTQVLSDSVEVEPGVYVVRGGNTKVPISH